MPDPFSQLLEWRRAEASARVLSKISPEFYVGTARYLAELRRSYEADLRENPSGRKGEISRQTYQRASQVARDILEARLQKILSAAFQASVGGVRELPNSLAEERTVFDQMLGTLTEFRREAAPYLETGASPAPAPPPAPPSAAPAPSLSTPAARPTAAAPPRTAAPPAPTYVRIVRATRPLELGTEKIDLREDDVLSLPPDTAKILVDGKIAEPLTTTPPPKRT